MCAPEGSNDRRSGPERRRRSPIVVPWQQPSWDSDGYTGPERRLGDRRSRADRQVSTPPGPAVPGQPLRQPDPCAAALR